MLTAGQALALLRAHAGRPARRREGILQSRLSRLRHLGRLVQLLRRAGPGKLQEGAWTAGFTAMKLKVGSNDPDAICAAPASCARSPGRMRRVMVDANQQWTLAAGARHLRSASRESIRSGSRSRPIRTTSSATRRWPRPSRPCTSSPSASTCPTAMIFKNYLQVECARVHPGGCRARGRGQRVPRRQPDGRQFGVPVVPHVGDMGQIHQHLVLFNHIGLDHEAVFLEHIPHLREHFVHPCRVEGGVYRTPAGTRRRLRFALNCPYPIVRPFSPKA